MRVCTDSEGHKNSLEYTNMNRGERLCYNVDLKQVTSSRDARSISRHLEAKKTYDSVLFPLRCGLERPERERGSNAFSDLKSFVDVPRLSSPRGNIFFFIE